MTGTACCLVPFLCGLLVTETTPQLSGAAHLPEHYPSGSVREHVFLVGKLRLKQAVILEEGKRGMKEA